MEAERKTLSLLLARGVLFIEYLAFANSKQCVQLLIKDTLRQVLSLVVISPQVGESVVEDIAVISEDDDRFIPTGFTAIVKAHDDGESYICFTQFT